MRMMRDSSGNDGGYEWSRRDDESKQSYDAFEIYLNLGISRTGKATSIKVNKSISLISRWSSKYNWIERARAWDNHNTKLFQESYDNATVEIAKRHARLGKTLQGIGMSHVDRIQKEGEEIDFRTATSTVKMGFDMERIAMGQATQVVSGKMNMVTLDVESMSWEELLERTRNAIARLEGIGNSIDGEE